MTTAGWKAVLFDLDGTLADTIELILRSFRHTMRTHLGEVPPDERFLEIIGIPLPTQLRGFARDEGEAELMRLTYVAYQREVHDEMVAPFPNAALVLSDLRRSGTRLAVVTSNDTRVARRTLEVCGLWGSVDAVVCADEVAEPKPHPESVHKALELLGLGGRVEETLFVGDSPFDLRAGRAAGTYTAAAVWGAFSRDALAVEKPDFYLSDLLGVLKTSSPRR
jgi:pyrophosphatase PpaX